MTTDPPPLKPLHLDESLSQPKLVNYNRLTTEELIESLAPGGAESLKVRPDGTVLNGHHRLRILRDRGVNGDQLPRDLVAKDDMPSDPGA